MDRFIGMGGAGSTAQNQASVYPATRDVPESSDTNPKKKVTALLLAWSQGETTALARLIPLVEHELRCIARRHMRREVAHHTLQPTALVNELYLKLADQRRVDWKSRAQFFGCAAVMMRRILVDHARLRRAKKRGAGMKPLSLHDHTDIPEHQDLDLVTLDDALRSLARVDRRQSRIVELRYFAGLKHAEIGAALGISERTARREWRTARLWLRRAMRRGPGAGAAR